MSVKILVPVFPSERFYDAVVRAGEVVAKEGGLLTFAFTHLRPSPEAYEDDPDGQPSELDISFDAGTFDERDVEKWREMQISGLDDAGQLLFDRGVSGAQINCVFAESADDEGAAQAIANEAAAGAYDLVILSRGYFEDEIEEEESTPVEVAEAVQAIDGVRLVVA